ncbi:transmembrane protein 179 [Latimeria chalumnae]|uniref:Zgc:153018 n=1 Tax=Latimeria chalumnae TaxID=7897 RepID=H3AGF1_LATCH|nr:PREDICTED: transmembrane protein 179-like [Latimeria chalumnae]|eukprot:XP_005988873.1 PREDICTED: transmembrane protein 179-like [Latimeria chalumnae]
MEIRNKLLLAQCVAYILALLAAFLAVVPLALNGSDFKDHCLLFGQGYWREENTTGSLVSRFVVEDWGPPSACQFSAFVGVFTLLFSAVQAWRSFFYLYKGHDDTFFSAFLNLLLSVSVLFLTLVAGVMVSVGFNAWCDAVTNHGSLPISCEEAQTMNLHLEVDTSGFYIHFGIAQFGLWAIWTMWVLLSVFAFLKVYRNYKRKDVGQCLAREKELLLDRRLRTRMAQQEQQTPSVFI